MLYQVSSFFLFNFRQSQASCLPLMLSYAKRLLEMSEYFKVLVLIISCDRSYAVLRTTALRLCRIKLLWAVNSPPLSRRRYLGAGWCSLSSSGQLPRCLQLPVPRSSVKMRSAHSAAKSGDQNIASSTLHKENLISQCRSVSDWGYESLTFRRQFHWLPKIPYCVLQCEAETRNPR